MDLNKFDDSRSCYFRNDLAYTEDNRLVYNLFFCNLKKKIELATMKQYFESFGKLLDIRFLPCKKNYNKYRSGNVHFAEAKSAAIVLKKSSHMLTNKQFFIVKASYTWLQPEEKCEPNANSNVDNNKTDISILNLNDDCLMQICCQLELKEQIHFAATCQRIANIIKLAKKPEFKVFDILKLNGLTLWEKRECFKTFGAFIEELHNTSLFTSLSHIFDFVENANCYNLKCLKFQFCKLHIAPMLSLFGQLKNVTTIEFCNCSLTDKGIATFKKLHNLQTLVLYGNPELTGKHIKHLTKVQHLNLGDCLNIQTTHMNEILLALIDLKTLNVQNCGKLSNSAISAIASSCKELETLKFTTTDCAYECVARLPKLKRLVISTVYMYESIRQQLFDELAKHKSSQLEYLKIVGNYSINVNRAKQLSMFTNLTHIICCKCTLLDTNGLNEICKLQQLEQISICWCPKVNDEGALNVIRHCLKLNRIILHGCKGITNSFVFSAIQVLKDRQANSAKGHSQPLVVVVSSTQVGETILLDTRVVEAEAAKLLNVIVDIDNDGLVDLFGSKDEFNCFDDDIDDEYDDDDVLSENDYLSYDDGLDDDDDDPYDLLALHGVFDEDELDLMFHYAYDQYAHNYEDGVEFAEGFDAWF